MPRIHTIEAQRLTPLGRLIFEYMRREWIPTKTDFARRVGIRPNTVDSLLYSDHEPSTRTLRKLVERTGIPATVVYAAVTPAPPPAVETFAPPMLRPVTHRQVEALTRPQLAERTPNTALDEAIARIRATEHPAMAEVMVQALLERAGRQDPRAYWQMRVEEEHNQAFISTLEVSAVPTQPPAHTTTTAEPQADSQPAGTRS